MDEAIVVRRLLAEDLAALQALRREALRLHPESFADSESDDSIVNATEAGPWLAPQGEQPVFGAWSGQLLCGMAGLYRHTGPKFRHKLQLWGMYVSPKVRARGVASQLLAAIIDEARSWPDALQLNLCVNALSKDAYELYRKCGFVEWGLEPGGFRHAGKSINDRHMALRL
jgi:GNAT superfamily N-acetyltransferase